MIVSREKLVADVRAMMGENRCYESLLRIDDSDTLTLNQRIAALAQVEADRLTASAPGELLDSPLWFADEDTPLWGSEEGRGRVRLPDDFLRLAAFRLARWPQAVWQPAAGDSARLRMLRAGVAPGILADDRWPCVALTRETDGLFLEFFSSSPADTPIAEALYWPRATLDREGGFHFSSSLYPTLVESVAGRIIKINR